MGDATHRQREQLTLTRVECQTLLQSMIREERYEVLVGGFALTRHELEIGLGSATITIGVHQRRNSAPRFAEGSIAEKIPVES